MDNVLYLELPRPVPLLSELVSILLFDVKNIIKLDCWDIGTTELIHINMIELCTTRTLSMLCYT